MITPAMAREMLAMPARRGSIIDRSLIEDRGHSTPCRIFTGRLDRNGYGLVGRMGLGKQRIHRISYIAHVGPIPEGLVIDHLCRQTACWNPTHLEAVTPEENTRRMMPHHPEIADNLRRMRSPRVNLPTEPRRPSQRTHCKRGHEFTPANTAMQQQGRWQLCVTCRNENQRRARARKAEAA